MRTLCFGEILLRLSPVGQQRLVQANHFEAVYGGSEANVAVSMALFGGETAFATRVPDHELGQSALQSVQRYGVSTDTSIRGGSRLGIYFLEQGIGRRASKVLYDRADSGMATLEPGMFDLVALLEGVEWLHWSGITPALSASAAASVLELLKAANQRGIMISCDLNYRATLWNYGAAPDTVMPALIQQTHVLLGDETAFEVCLGLKILGNSAVEDVLAQVMSAYPLLLQLAITRREGHSATHNTYQGYLFDGSHLFTSTKHDLPDILDRIGTGDAFMAGLIWGLQTKPDDLQTVVEMASAAAALKHYVPGDFNICTLEEVLAVAKGDTGGRVRR